MLELNKPDCKFSGSRRLGTFVVLSRPGFDDGAVHQEECADVLPPTRRSRSRVSTAFRTPPCPDFGEGCRDDGWPGIEERREAAVGLECRRGKRGGTRLRGLRRRPNRSKRVLRSVEVMCVHVQLPETTVLGAPSPVLNSIQHWFGVRPSQRRGLDYRGMGPEISGLQRQA